MTLKILKKNLVKISFDRIKLITLAAKFIQNFCSYVVYMIR